MAELAAPYFSANDLNAQPGNAALGGGMQQNPNILPNSGLGNTIDQLIAEKASATEAKKQRIFQQQQAEERYRQDALTRVQDYAHSDAVMKYKQGQEDIRNTYQQLANGQQSAFNAKDAQGNDQSFQPAPGDQDVMNKSADDLRKRIHADPSLATDPSFNQDFLNHQKMVATAGARAVTLTKLKQQLTQTTDPAERKNIQDSMDEIVNTPTNQLPDAHLPTPLDVNLIPTDEELAKMYPQGKGYQSYTDESGNEKVGLPEHHIDEIIYAPAGSTKARQISNAVSLFQKDPIANDPTAFTQWSAQVNQRRRDMGQPELNLGQVTKDGQVILNPDKRQVAAGLALMHAPWQDDPDADSGEDKELIKAQTRKANADADNAEFKASGGTRDKGNASQQASINTVNRAWNVFNPDQYADQKNNPGQPIVAQTVPGKKHWYGDEKSTTGYKPISGVDVGAKLKEEGMEPKDWVVYPAPAGVEEGVGVQKETPGTNTQGGPTGKTFKSGEDEKVDKKFVLYNPSKKEVKLMYVQNTPETKKDNGDKKDAPAGHKVLSIVSGRDYVTNAPNGKHQWAATGKEAGALADEKTQNQDLWDAKTGGAQGNVVAPAPVTKTFNGVTYEMGSNGRWYKK